MSVVVAVDVKESADTENPVTTENQGLSDCHEAETRFILILGF